MSDDPPPDRAELERRARNLEAEIGLRARSDHAWIVRRRWLIVRPVAIAAAIPALLVLIVTAGAWQFALAPALASAIASLPVAWKRPPIALALVIYTAVMGIFVWCAVLGLVLCDGLLLLLGLFPISVPIMVGTGIMVGWSAQAIDEH